MFQVKSFVSVLLWSELLWELLLLLLVVPSCCSPGEYAIIPPFPFPLVDGTEASRPKRQTKDDFYYEGRFHLLRQNVFVYLKYRQPV